jgi:hypothetical protein
MFFKVLFELITEGHQLSLADVHDVRQAAHLFFQHGEALVV